MNLCHVGRGVALGLVGALSAGADSVPVDKELRMTNDTVEVVVVPSRARIERYGFLGGTNLLWTLPDAESYAAKVGNWNNWGGDKAWIWPQEDWKQNCGAAWPPPRQTEVAESALLDGGRAVRLVSPVVDGYGVRIVRDILLAPTGSTLTVRTRLVPETGIAAVPQRPFAAWTVTQVSARNDGLYARGLAAGASWCRLGNGESLPEPVSIQGTRVVRVSADGTRDGGKSGFEGDAFAVRYGNVLFTQRALPFAAATFGPGERAQIYISPASAPQFPESAGPYVELEFTAPLAPHADVARHELTVVWTLDRLPTGADDAEIARRLETLAAD